jgi:putative endonuclease
MPSEHPPEVKCEIGHVLFIDIVGYSKLLISEQSEQSQKLKEIVRGTEQVRAAEAEGKLLRLPTGDGGALVFGTTPEAPVLCALEIATQLKKYRRTWEHRECAKVGFAAKYQCKKRIYYEHYRDICDAIARESQLKKWSRAKKIGLINRLNPRWEGFGADVLHDR